MFKKPVQFDGVAANSTASLKLHGTSLWGNVINRVIMKLGGTVMTKALITAIRVFADGKIIVNTTGSRADARMQYRGIAASATYLTLDFTEIRSKTIKGQNLGSLDTRLLSQLSIEVDIGAATAPTLESRIEAMSPVDYDAIYDPVERALIGKVLSQNLQFSQAGEFAIPLPFGNQGGSLIKRLHFHSALVTGVRIIKNGLEDYNLDSGYNSFILSEYQRTVQANHYPVDFIKDGNQSGVLNAAAAKAMEYYVTVSGAGTVPLEMEMLDPLANN